MWSLKMLHKLLVPQKNSNTSGAPLLNFLKNKAPADSALSKLLDELPAAILKQYEYEEPCVRGGTHLMHSDFFKVSTVLWIPDSDRGPRELHPRSIKWIMVRFH